MPTILVTSTNGLLPTMSNCGGKQDSNQFIITFTCTDGVTLSSSTDIKVKKNTKWSEILNVPTATIWQGYVDIGWYDIDEMKMITDNTIITKDTNVKYIALDESKTIVNVTVKTDKETYDAVPFIQGATFGQFKEYYPAMKETPQKDHYNFAGWYHGETIIDKDDWIFPEDTQNLTIEAHFEQITYSVDLSGVDDAIKSKFKDFAYDGESYNVWFSIPPTHLWMNRGNILVNNISIISRTGVVFSKTHIFIPSEYITGNITIIIQLQPLLFDQELTDIVTYCNQHESGTLTDEQFLSKFTFGGDTLSEIDELIGRQIKLTINSQPHYARVIGVHHDGYKIDELHTGHAALTFELITLLSDTKGDCMTSKWDLSNCYDYTNSILRKNLTGEGTASGEDVWNTSAYSMLTAGTPALRDNIKKVNKECSKYSDHSFGWNYYEDYLFPLTYIEIGGYGDKWVRKEGSVYKYWNDHYETEYHIKRDASGDAHSYWLASPYTYIGESDHHAWYVSRGGHILGSSVDGGIGVSFGFCI